NLCLPPGPTLFAPDQWPPAQIPDRGRIVPFLRRGRHADRGGYILGGSLGCAGGGKEPRPLRRVNPPYRPISVEIWGNAVNRGGMPASEIMNMAMATDRAAARWPSPPKSSIRTEGDSRAMAITTPNAPRFMTA